LLASVPEDGEFVFPSHYTERSKGGHMGQPKEGIKLLRERSGIEDWSLHDLRRTVRTRLPSLGVTPDVAERVLGHSIVGIRRVYDHHDYVPQKMAALEAWSAELERIVQQPATPEQPEPASKSKRRRERLRASEGRVATLRRAGRMPPGGERPHARPIRRSLPVRGPRPGEPRSPREEPPTAVEAAEGVDAEQSGE